MPLTAEQYAVLVVVEVGDVDALIAGQIEVLWLLYDSQTDDYLHYLYTKRKAIDLLMGKVREQVSRRSVNDITIDLTDKLKNLQIMWGNVNAEIKALEAKAAMDAEQLATAGQAAVGQLAAPYSDPTGITAPTAAETWRQAIIGWRP